MKCFFGVLLGLFISSALAEADPATDLYNQGTAAYNQNDFKTAASDLDQIIANYPSTALIHTVRLEAGLAHLRLGDFAKTVDILAKETAPGAPSQGTALFYTGVAQLQLGNKLTDPAARNAAFAQAAATMTRLVDTIASAPTTENRDFTEDALYNRALAYFYEDQSVPAEADVQRLLQNFPSSLSRPDWQLLLGNLYARQASEALNARQSDDAVRALATQAEQSFDAAISDPNALVQANEARLAKAETLVLVAPFDLPSLDGYERALDAFRAVRRKADLIPLQQEHLRDLTAKNQAQLQSSLGGTVSLASNSALARLIDRETGRLADLQNGPDPVVQALIGIAQCYNAMKQGDEARTVLHRLAHATLTPEEQQSVDFALIYSYVLGGETAKADQALSDFLAKHPGDPRAEGLSVQMAGDLMKRKDYQGALDQANRSLKDFPTGAYAADAVQLKAEALRALGQLDAAKAVGDDFVAQHPGSAVAIGLMLNRAQAEVEQGDLNAALADYGKVKDSTQASAELQASGAAGYMQTLQALKRTDDVIAESKAFAAKFPSSPLLPNVLVMGAIALDAKHDPGAVAALQDVAKKYPADDENSPAPFALYYVVNIDERAGNVPAMVQAAAALTAAFPNRYALRLQAADAVTTAYVKQKKFDLAIAQYQPLISAAPPDVAAIAQAKIGDLWLKSAKSMGAYQSMQDPAQRAEAEKRLGSAETAFLEVLKDHGDQLTAVNNAFAGLNQDLLQRRSWGLLKDADFEAYLAKLTAGLTDPAMQTHVELAKAGLIFIEKEGRKQDAAALDRFRAALAANPSLALTRTESDNYGELLLNAKDFATAQQVYQKLLDGNPKDPYAEADAYYGLGAVDLAQGNVAAAGGYFEKMKQLPGGAAWNAHILDANYGIALAAEQSGQPADLAAAKQDYAALMQSPQATPDLQARAMLGYGRVLAAEGATTAPKPGSADMAVYYFKQVDTLFGPAVPELSAEGLYNAAQLYAKAGNTANAQALYQQLIKNYATSAPDWAAKAQAAQ